MYFDNFKFDKGRNSAILKQKIKDKKNENKKKVTAQNLSRTDPCNSIRNQYFLKEEKKNTIHERYKIIFLEIYFHA